VKTWIAYLAARDVCDAAYAALEAAQPNPSGAVMRAALEADNAAYAAFNAHRVYMDSLED
jgi:hypothetical protein